MFSQVYYLVRSRADGRYLVAHPNTDAEPSKSSYLLMFREHFDALSYLNTHGSDTADRFGVESVPGSQVGGLLKRWVLPAWALFKTHCYRKLSLTHFDSVKG